MRNALRDAELPPPAGGWERLERELGGAAPGPGASETAAPRGSVWRIYWPRIAAAAAVVLLGVVAGDYMLRPDKALENDGNVIASAVGEEATAVTMPQPREAESVQETLARVAGLADVRTAASAVQRPELLAAAVKPAAKTMAAETIAETTTAETERAAVAEPEAVTAADAVADGVSAQRTAAESSQPAAEPAANTVGERPATRSKTGVSARTAYYDEPLTAYKPPRRKTSLSAFAAGGVSGASGGNGAAPWMYSSVTNDVSSIATITMKIRSATTSR